MHILFNVLVLFLFIRNCLIFVSALECTPNSTPSSAAYTITVSLNGIRNFSTIRDALNFIPTTNNQWIKILIKRGTYKEQIKLLSKSCIVLEGEGRSTTFITNDAHDMTDGSITFDAYDVHNFVVKGITFRNSYNRPLKSSERPIPAVAFRAYGDKHEYISCGFEGYQDTLWDAYGRHYFSSCYIEGAVDFIWGDAQSVYEDCLINVTGVGFIIAQGRETSQSTSGYVFNRCKIIGTGHVTLGRAYGPFSRVIFINSFFNNVVNPEGWFIWRQTGHENDVVFAEINCKGPGADVSKRVSWAKKLNKYEVGQYSTNIFIDQEHWIEKYRIN